MRTTRLLPGDFLLTGSPSGNGIQTGRFLHSGDVVDGAITGRGAQRIPCVTDDDNRGHAENGAPR